MDLDLGALLDEVTYFHGGFEDDLELVVEVDSTFDSGLLEDTVAADLLPEQLVGDPVLGLEGFRILGSFYHNSLSVLECGDLHRHLELILVLLLEFYVALVLLGLHPRWEVFHYGDRGSNRRRWTLPSLLRRLLLCLQQGLRLNTPLLGLDNCHTGVLFRLQAVSDALCASLIQVREMNERTHNVLVVVDEQGEYVPIQAQNLQVGEHKHALHHTFEVHEAIVSEVKREEVRKPMCNTIKALVT
jgi:hypothetical protein